MLLLPAKNARASRSLTLPAISAAFAERSTLSMSVATTSDRDEIYRIRHDVYARELGQHALNGVGLLTDPLDAWNTYLVVKIGGGIAGFVSITPPGTPAYSIDKYFAREDLPFPVDDNLYEVRVLTVVAPHRGRETSLLLMYAAFRWVESHGGTHIVAIGREEILDFYRKAGMQVCFRSATSGAVRYELLHASIDSLSDNLRSLAPVLARLESRTRWHLSFPFRTPAPCFHGGAFFDAIGPAFGTLNRRHTIISADVLDAWFPPAPGVVTVLREHLPWLMRTSPPTGSEGLLEAIAETRGVRTRNILPGSGSSDLIFRALRHWLAPASRALILDPTYGEYAHVLERVIGCTVDRLPLTRGTGYALDLAHLEAALAREYDLVVLVNPNSPTGNHVPRAALEEMLRDVPASTRVWVDETYVEYAGQNASLESFAASSENVIVCKSMSKVYALSGARVAYLCAGAHQLEALRAITPPWVVSLPAQVAAVHALGDPSYYAARYADTHALRDNLASELGSLGWSVVPGIANFVLCHLNHDGPPACEVVRRCREDGLFVRDAGALGASLGAHAIRVAVKDAATNRRMVEIIASHL